MSSQSTLYMGDFPLLDASSAFSSGMYLVIGSFHTPHPTWDRNVRTVNVLVMLPTRWTVLRSTFLTPVVFAVWSWGAVHDLDQNGPSSAEYASKWNEKLLLLGTFLSKKASISFPAASVSGWSFMRLGAGKSGP